MNGLLAGVQRETADVAAQVIPFNLPPIIGLGTAGGFEYQLQNIEGRPAAEMAGVMRALVLAANQDPALQRVFSTFAANTPTVFLTIDREKAQVLGVPIDSIFAALQASLGSAYVNDFNLFGRTWQVNIQAEARDRAGDHGHLPRPRPQRDRRDGAGPRARRGADRVRAADRHPLQQCPQPDHQR